MAIIVSNIKTGLNQGREDIFRIACRTAHLNREQVKEIYLVKSSVDARKRDQIHIVSSV